MRKILNSMGIDTLPAAAGGAGIFCMR